MGNITLGLCMIVKNEEKVIGRCLDSVKDAFDEIVIVDTGSTDATKEIVKKYTDKVYDFEWIYDFSAARNYSFLQSTCDYIMWLDADDVVYPRDLIKLLEFKENIDPTIEGYRMYYSYIQDQNDRTTLLQQRIRVIKNHHKPIWEGKIHEVIPCNLKLPTLDITIHHKKQAVAEPDRNLNIYERMEKAGEKFSTRDLFLYAVELSGHRQNEKALKVLSKMFRRKNDYNNNKFYFNEAILIKYKVYRMQKRSSEEIKKMLLGFLENFAPSAAVCCELGNIFNEQIKVDAAKFWFESALKIAKQHPEDHVEYNEFCPYYGLAYCHFYYGNLKKAIDYSSRAIALFPNNQFAQKNHELYWKEYLKRERMKHNEKQ